MSTESLPAQTPIPGAQAWNPRLDGPWAPLVAILKPLASLRLTVILFAMAIFIIFVGTLAQVEKDMWEVIDQYFRTPITFIEMKLFFPPSFYPGLRDVKIPGGFYFPGGALIGGIMFLNLVAAHAVRFKVQATGQRQWWGIGTLAVGTLLTWLVISSGHNGEGLQAEPPFSWSTMWDGMKLCLALAWAGCVIALFRSEWSTRLALFGWGSLVLGLGALLFYLVGQGQAAQLSDSSLRILWQLIQGGAAAIVLLIGCVLLFKRRGGIVLIHLGVGLVMFGELWVSFRVVEERISFAEGETVNFARDIRTTELAVIDSSGSEFDDVVVIPRSVLLAGDRISHEDLPIDLEVVEYLKNSSLVDLEQLASQAVVQDRQADQVREQAKQMSEMLTRMPDPDAKAQVEQQIEELAEQAEQLSKDAIESRESEAELRSTNRATDGLGRRHVATESRASAGAAASQEVDAAACYLRVLPKNGGDDRQTAPVYLLSQQFGDGEILTRGRQDIPEPIEANGKTYFFSLRYKRAYKPYQLTLQDVRKDDYKGTSTPRNYSSDVHLVDASRDTERDVHIWMNNPLRYANETFYQSNYVALPDGTEVSDLQVVTNTGWMIPYVACMLVAAGMLAHFGTTLVRFMNRQLREMGDRSADQEASQRKGKQASTGPLPAYSDSGFVVPFVIVCVCAFWVWNSASQARVGPPAEPEAMDLAGFGQIPIVYQGRVKPLDTLARNALRIVSDKQTYVDADGVKQPAIKWLLDLIAFSPAADEAEVVRIHNLEVQANLGLERRKEYRYSLNEIRGSLDELSDLPGRWLPTTEITKLRDGFYREVRDAISLAESDASKLSPYQRKLVETAKRIGVIDKLQSSFRPIPFPPIPTEEEFESNPDEATQTLLFIKEAVTKLPRLHEAMMRTNPPPLVIPLENEEDEWQPYAMAANNAYVRQTLLKKEPNRHILSWTRMLNAYQTGDVTSFNSEVNQYQASLRTSRLADVDFAKTDFEVFFNQFRPFYLCMVLCVLGFVLTASSWLCYPRVLNRTAFCLIVLTLLVHSYAIIARIYISGRPPVTTLYTSAVFIGWGGVLIGLVLEWIYRIGMGNVVATVTGFCTLFVAHNLAGDGDTFTVLQAVLDTQFWLATHVICITLGYATTFVAGALGVIYIVRGVLTPSLTSEVSKKLARMTYGVLCFAVYFSFIGTVLGGLWADDSWGRFWGWDPKENGALIIVLWNALILHARWGGMIRERGLAVLAAAGNITTCWSWFGVNELGIGLHSYGFTEGVLRNLAIVAVVHLTVIVLGLLPFSLWKSHRRVMASA